MKQQKVKALIKMRYKFRMVEPLLTNTNDDKIKKR